MLHTSMERFAQIYLNAIERLNEVREQDSVHLEQKACNVQLRLLIIMTLQFCEIN